MKFNFSSSLQVHRWVNVESMLKACVIGKLVGSAGPQPPQKSNLLQTPRQQATTLNVTNKPKKIPQNVKKLSVPNVGMLAPPKPLTKKNISSLSVPIKSNPKITVPAKNISETNVPPKIILDKNVPAINMDGLKVDGQAAKEKVSWSQTSKTVTIKYLADFKVENLTCDVLNEGKKVLLKVFSKLKFSRGFDISLGGKVKDKILMVAVKDKRVSVELMKSLEGDWPELGEINEIDQSQASIYRRCEIAGKSPVTHDTDLYKLRLLGNSLMMTSPGAHVRLQAEVLGVQVQRPYTVALPSLSNPSDEYMTSHAYDIIHVMIKHYDDGVMTSQLKKMRIGDLLEVSFEGEGCFDLEKLEKVNIFVA